MAKNTTEANSDQLSKGKSISIGEIGKEDIERVTENDFADAAELEAFMNEPVTIIVQQDREKGSLPVIVPSVNGVNQPIIRNQKITIKRKYVEALARCRFTAYEQEVPDPNKPENIQMKEKTDLMYPFTVLEDRNPNGREWLLALLAAA